MFEREKKQPGQHPQPPQSQVRGGGGVEVVGTAEDDSGTAVAVAVKVVRKKTGSKESRTRI